MQAMAQERYILVTDVSGSTKLGVESNSQAFEEAFDDLAQLLQGRVEYQDVASKGLAGEAIEEIEDVCVASYTGDGFIVLCKQPSHVLALGSWWVTKGGDDFGDSLRKCGIRDSLLQSVGTRAAIHYGSVEKKPFSDGCGSSPRWLFRSLAITFACRLADSDLARYAIYSAVVSEQAYQALANDREAMQTIWLPQEPSAEPWWQVIKDFGLQPVRLAHWKPQFA